jgi:hypothetical protein
MRKGQRWSKPNRYRYLDNMVVEIELTQGLTCLVDAVDLSDILAYKWYASGKPPYATTWRNGRAIKLHHLLLGRPEDGYEIDHVNQNSLDCQRNNLRIVDKITNCMNTSKTPISKLFPV